MFRFVLAILTLAACGPDYDVNGIHDPPDPPVDTAVGPRDTFLGDTGTGPQDTEDSPVSENPPIAICSVNPTEVTVPLEVATWQGGASYDPAGHAITKFNWTLTARPTGSAAFMPTGYTSNRNFYADLAGEYTARLIVTTDDNRVSEPCEVTLNAVPGNGLHVEMFWVHSNDDMDLHLLKPGGSPRSNSGDCYYANTHPSWGPGGPEDDPRLDLDDIPGTGPENINIADPYSGTYTVFVNDYTGSTPDYYQGNDVTVNIYLAGNLIWTDTRTITGEGADEYFATVDIPSGTVTPQ